MAQARGTWRAARAAFSRAVGLKASQIEHAKHESPSIGQKTRGFAWRRYPNLHISVFEIPKTYFAWTGLTINIPKIIDYRFEYRRNARGNNLTVRVSYDVRWFSIVSGTYQIFWKVEGSHDQSSMDRTSLRDTWNLVAVKYFEQDAKRDAKRDSTRSNEIAQVPGFDQLSQTHWRGTSCRWQASKQCTPLPIFLRRRIDSKVNRINRNTCHREESKIQVPDKLEIRTPAKNVSCQ